MSFCKLSSDYIKDGFTLVENAFFNVFMNKADGVYVKVYLYGLYLAQQNFMGSDIEKMAIALTVSEDKVIEAYRYWEEKGIVRISKTLPYEIEYLSCKRPQTQVIKRNAKKYSEFCDECQRFFSEDVIMPNEYEKLFTVIEDYKIDVNAMLTAIRYSIDLKKGKANIAFIIAIATNWAKEGLTTLEDFENRIKELEYNNEDIRQIFQELGVKRTADIEDRQLYLKWTKDYGYDLNAILVACKMCKKRGGTDKLDKIIEELKLAEAFTALEIDQYAKEKDERETLTLEIIKTIGEFYSSYQVVTDTYVIPWLNKGYDSESLLLLAKLCFKSGIKTLSGLDKTIEKFYKSGIIEKKDIENYIEREVMIENRVREILDAANSQKLVSRTDKDFYRTFVETWGFSHEGIVAVAESVKDNPFPISIINKKLSALKQKNIYELDEIKNYIAANITEKTNTSGKALDNKNSFVQREYTKEEINRAVINLDLIEIDLEDEDTDL